MSTAQSAWGGSGAAGEADGWSGSWRRSCGASRWSPFEIIAMVLGFIVFWPIGLAILGFKIWQRRSGYPGDLQTVVSDKWREARGAMDGVRRASPGPRWGSSGNSAFDDWRAAEIARLDEERRKLQEAHREFSEFVDNIRRSKDREEFERFMNERRNRPAGGPATGA